MTVLTQLSAGALAAVWMLQLFGGSARLGLAAVVSLSVACLALAASTLHLGRPVHAYRALRMWRRSWLSREVLLFGAFSGVATSYAALLWFGLPGSLAAGGLTAILGAAGVTASAYIYRVPARPAWNTPFTVAQFHLTAGILGPLVAAAFGAGDPGTLGFVVALLSGVQLAVFAIHFFHCAASDSLPLAGTARLLSSVLAPTLLLRAGLLVVAGIALPLLAGGAPAATGPGDFVPFMSSGALIMSVALVLAGAAEILGRYLFFVSVVPQHAAAPYLAAGSEAA
jgi:DMSO reductase anchor subunit